jgi:hypothetical protein
MKFILDSASPDELTKAAAWWGIDNTQDLAVSLFIHPPTEKGLEQFFTGNRRAFKAVPAAI